MRKIIVKESQLKYVLDNMITEHSTQRIVENKHSDYKVYHNSYTSAINTALEYAEKFGYQYNKDETFTKIGMGPRKPTEGETNKIMITLFKDGKEQKKSLHIQVYGMSKKYELNCYIS